MNSSPLNNTRSDCCSGHPKRGPYGVLQWHNYAQSYNYAYKVVVVGDSGGGKTCLIKRFVHDEFNPNFVSTIGVDFENKQVEVDGVKVLLRLWDTAGQERFRSITRSFFRGSDGIMLVFDVTNQESFDHLQEWRRAIKDCASEGVSIVLVGNRCDVASERKVDYASTCGYADRFGIPYIETSAKDDVNVEQAFITLVAHIMTRRGHR